MNRGALLENKNSNNTLLCHSDGTRKRIARPSGFVEKCRVAPDKPNAIECDNAITQRGQVMITSRRHTLAVGIACFYYGMRAQSELIYCGRRRRLINSRTTFTSKPCRHVTATGSDDVWWPLRLVEIPIHTNEMSWVLRTAACRSVAIENTHYVGQWCIFNNCFFSCRRET